jgi:two-component system nitrogen regulation response regulator GlnG
MGKINNVWIVDDDRSIRWVLEKALNQADIRTQTFDSGEAISHQLQSEQPDAIISDIRMPGIDGLELLARLGRDYPGLPVIITTAHSDLDSAVASYQGGAFEYLPKPFDIDEAVAMTKRALAHARERFAQPVAEPAHATPEIIGEAPAMQEVFRAIGRLAQSQATVLITGESGTGTVRARANHSSRSIWRPFRAT